MGNYNARGEQYRQLPAAAGLGDFERMMAIVEAMLREMFPDDFFRRCAFAAFGLRALIEDGGVEARLVGGQFGAFVMTPDRRRLAVQGFGSGPEPFPHLWVETPAYLIDLGPHLLAFGSEYRIVGMPAVIWDLAAPMPAALRYKASGTLPPGARISADRSVSDLCDVFVDRCRDRELACPKGERLRTWIATNYGSLEAAVRLRDRWALGAKRFERTAQHQPLPF